MIIRNGLNIKDINKNKGPLKMVYYHGALVWNKDNEIIQGNSCFGSGYWVNSLPWINSDAWRNN